MIFGNLVYRINRPPRPAIHLAGGTQLAFHPGSERWRGKPVSFVELCFQPIDPLQKILRIFG
jgi:hypothetical protein